MEGEGGNGGLPYGSMPPKGIALRRESSRRYEPVSARSNPADDDDEEDDEGDLGATDSGDPQGRHNLRPRRRSRYSAAAEEGEGYSDAEDYEDDLGSGSMGRDEGGRKKVGRPIAYKGDPNSPHLTEDERRRIKRRIANRESARRVRQKRQDVMEDLQVKINALQAQNQRLMAHVGEVEAHKGMLTGQVTTLRSKWTNASNDNMRLQAELGTLRKTLQMQQANLEMLQRGHAGAPGSSMPQQPLQQQPQLHQSQQQPGSSTPADMFNNLATMYGLPSAQPNTAAGSVSNPAEAGPTRLSGPPLPSSHPASGSQLSAFSNGGGSAFSPIAPMQGSGIPAASAHSMGRQPSDTWNFINAAVRMGSGSLGIGGLGTYGSEQLPESLGLGPTSSALNIAALNPAGSGRLPDLSPLNAAGSGRLPDLYGASRGVEVSPALSSGLSRPLGSPAELPPLSRRGSAQAGNVGSPLGRTSEHQQERSSPVMKPEAAGGHAEEVPQNGHRTPVPARQAAEEDTDDIHPASALLFLKSSEPQGRHPRTQAASR